MNRDGAEGGWAKLLSKGQATRSGLTDDRPDLVAGERTC